MCVATFRRGAQTMQKKKKKKTLDLYGDKVSLKLHSLKVDDRIILAEEIHRTSAVVIAASIEAEQEETRSI